MDGPLDGGGGGVSSGGSSNGSLSTVVSKEANLVLSSEVSSSSCPNDYELELNLGLSLGCGGGAQVAAAAAANSTGGAAYRAAQFSRILTAEDFPSVVSKASSSSSVTKVSNNPSCGTKRSAESFSPPRSGVRCPVVGWPPVRTHRMNTLMNQGKSPTAEDCDSTIAKSETKSVMPEKTDGKKNNDMEKDPKKSLFVKVNMDGIPIGRKVDLNAHSCYKALAQTLDDMFCRPSTCVASRQEQGGVTTPTGSLRLLGDLSEFVLTYEDKEGDWMLVGDVPWEMFILSVKRLKIMKTSEANGLAPISPPRDEGRRIKPI